MKKNNIFTPLNKKGIAFLMILAFAWFQFSLADENSPNYFEDLDGDGLTNQEEEALGTNPNKVDTDGDGYSDGVEMEAGFDPLVKDKEQTETVSSTQESAENLVDLTQSTEEELEEPTEVTKEENGENQELGEVNATEVFIQNIQEQKKEELELLNQAAVDEEILETIESSGDDAKYSLTEEEVQAIVEETVREVKLDNELVIIPEEELNIQEKPEENNEQALEEEKKAVEEYFVQVGYVIFEEAPFLFQDGNNLMGVATTLITGMGTDIEDGDSSNLTNFKGKSEAIYEKIKELEAPYVLKDVHKMGLSLQKYMLGQDETLATDKDDPVALTSMLGKVQAVMSEMDALSEDTMDVLEQLDIDSFDVSGISNSVDLDAMMGEATMYGL